MDASSKKTDDDGAIRKTGSGETGSDGSAARMSLGVCYRVNAERDIAVNDCSRLVSCLGVLFAGVAC
jgi:hypothetical protein